MDSLEFNKAFAAVLTAGIAFMGASILSETLVRPRRPEHTVIKVEGVQASEPAPEAPKGPVVPIANLLASADVGAGETAAKRLCTSCHSFNEGGKAAVGPNLYGVVGAPHGHQEGFQYSAVIKGKEGPWTYEDLNAWLLNPRGYAPGTKMAFAGIANDKQRADVILYLRSLAKDPQPLPQPQEQPASAGGAQPTAAAGAAAGGGDAAAIAATPTPPQSGANAPTEGVTRPQGGQVQGAPGGSNAGAGAGTSSGTVGQSTQPNVSQNQSQSEQNQSNQPPQATPSR